jgi:ABC-type lipoprotein release transport system permease subunit
MNFITLFFFAWRNLWRNRKRTIITASSIFFGVIFSIELTSLQQGSFVNMIDNMVKYYSGYLQIQEPDFWDTRSINNTFEYDEQVELLIEGTSLITQYTPRLESFALASSGSISQGTIVLGISPDLEQELSGLSKWVGEGEYLVPGERGVLVGETLAGNLDIGVHDSIILIGQGYHGVTAAGIYEIKGLLTLPDPDLSRQLLYMDINAAQTLYSASNRLTSLVLMVEKPGQVSSAREEISNGLPNGYSALTWDELQPEMVQFIDGKQSSGKIMISILFVIIAFGILGTVIMLMSERRRELGVMISLGMKRVKLIWILIFETTWIGILGVSMGMAVSIPIVGHFVNKPIPLGGSIAETISIMGFEPIIMFSNASWIFYNPALTVFIIVLVISIYPALFISRIKVVDALRA